jgi:hypothetical protein
MLLAWHGAKCSEPVVGKGLFRYQAIKSRRGGELRKDWRAGKPGWPTLDHGRLLQPGTGSRDTAEKCTNRFGSLLM